MTTRFSRIFPGKKPVIAMVHFGALPGSPLHDSDAGLDGLVEGVRNDLRALDPSAADAPAYRRLTTTYDQLERTLGELETAAKQEQPYTIERLSSRVDRLVTSSEKIARELGATGCAR